MRKFATLALIWLAAAFVIAEDIKLKYVRPSAVIGQLAQVEIGRREVFVGEVQNFERSRRPLLGRLEGTGSGMVPKGVLLVAFDSVGILEVTGPTDGVSRVREMVALFDIEPRRLELRLTTACPVLNSHTTLTAALYNNKRWTTSDDLVNLAVGVTGRIDSDGSITLYIDLDRETTKQEIRIRVKPQQIVRLKVGGELVTVGTITKELPQKGMANIDDPDVYLELKVGIATDSGAQLGSRNPN